MTKRVLGRGLGALLPPPVESSPEGGILELPLDRLVPNPYQPRREFPPESLAELAASIRTAGILQPIVARQRGERYEILVGERRWRAAREAGLDRVPVLVRDATDAEAVALALVENLLREDLNPLEEAEAYHRLLAEFGWTQEELARRIGRDRSSIANALRLRRLTMGHARALLGLPTEAAQLRLRAQILAQDWSVRATEAGIRRQRGARLRARRLAELEAVEEELRRTLGTRVRIVGTLSRGRIEVSYGSAEELERLRGWLARGIK